jgi:undecaprenyl-diphosphatase
LLKYLSSLDDAAYEFINLRLTSEALDPVALGLSSGVLWVALLAAAIPFFALRRKPYFLKVFLTLLTAVSLSDALCYHVLKPGFARVRPCHGRSYARRVDGICGSEFGMPSNHASNGMAAATVIALASSRGWALIAFGLALLVGYSRVYLGVHYPGDVFVGFLFGSFFGIVSWSLFHPWIKKK